MYCNMFKYTISIIIYTVRPGALCSQTYRKKLINNHPGVFLLYKMLQGK